MKDLMSILRDAAGSIKLEINGADLMEFSNELINRQERYLTKEEVKQICEVCDTTLWH